MSEPKLRLRVACKHVLAPTHIVPAINAKPSVIYYLMASEKNDRMQPSEHKRDTVEPVLLRPDDASSRGSSTQPSEFLSCLKPVWSHDDAEIVLNSESPRII